MEDFTSNNNKALLWNLLYEQKIFDAIPDAHVKQIKYIFDKEISNISQVNQNPKTSLMELNKHAIQIVSGRVQMYKEENSNFHDKKKEMELSLNKKQVEFDTLMNKAVPEAPEFTDQKDEPFNDNSMEDLLNIMISTREKQLNQVLTLESASPIPIPQSNQENQSNQSNQENQANKSTPVLTIGRQMSLDSELVNVIHQNNEKQIDLDKDNLDNNKSSKFFQNLKRINLEKTMVNEYTSEQKFNEQSKLDAISNQLTALMEKVTYIERVLERRDSMSSLNSLSLSPPK
jgi:hypothetical protein